MLFAALNERGRRALSQAEFVKGLWKEGRGAGLVFVCSLLQTWWAQLAAVWCAGPVGVRIRKLPGSAVQRVWMAVPRNPLCTACWQSIRVRSGSRDPELLRGALRLPEAASRRSWDGKHADAGRYLPCGSLLSPFCSKPSRYGSHTPSLPSLTFYWAPCSTCSRREPSSPSRRATRTRWILTMLHGHGSNARLIV